jgi:saccharopine dehydrogenase (NADP+, L-glutamate forming)
MVFPLLIHSEIGKISKTGVLAPMDWDIVEPLIQALEKEGIFMTEEIL